MCNNNNITVTLLDAIKGDSHEPELSRMLKSAFKFASEDASNIMLPLRKANEDYLSESEKEALDASIQENASLSFEQLKNKSHDKIWLKNYREGKGKKVIATMDLAESAHASEAMKEYIKENLEHLSSKLNTPFLMDSWPEFPPFTIHFNLDILYCSA